MKKDSKNQWYLGLDIGTNSIGWAVTDMQYNLLSIKNKQSWGVRLFEKGETAQNRREKRNGRRRIARRRWRLSLLEELFKEEIAKVDMGFYQRLKESQYHLDDKSIKESYLLFNEADYTDKEFFKKYPTIYHLRQKLMDEKLDEAPDIREVFLACHHLIKYRGHFHMQGENYKEGELRSLVNELLCNDYTSENISYENIDESVVDKICEIMLANKTANDRGKDLEKLEDLKNMKGILELLKLAIGLKASLATIFGMEEDNDLDVKTISFENNIYDEVRDSYEGVLGNSIEVIDIAKIIFDTIALSKIKKSGKTFSERKVLEYNKHKEDIKTLKGLINNDSCLSKKDKKELKDRLFRIDEKKGKNYVNYSGNSKNGTRCSYKDFKNTIVAVLNKLRDPKSTDDIKKIKEELELGKFARLQRVKDNGGVPYQVHLYELQKILANMTRFYGFLNDKDENGNSVKDKIEMLLKFRIPYYVGPLNAHHSTKKGGFAWAVKKENTNGKIVPWNFDKIIDAEKSAEKFIENLTNKCTYLVGEDVLPKNSLLYSEYALLNELNTITYGGERLTKNEKDAIVNEFFKKNAKKATAKALKTFLENKKDRDKIGEIEGINVSIKGDLKSYRDFYRIFGDKLDTKMAEEIIKWITLFGKSKEFVESKIKSKYSDKVNDEQIKELLKLNYKEWGKLSEKLLSDITSNEKCISEETVKCLNIIKAMREKSLGLNELLSSRYDFSDKINKHNAEKVSCKFGSRVSHEILDGLYLSPAVRRSVWQAVKIVEELKKLIGSKPKKIFVETTRTNRAKKEEAPSRKVFLVDVYKNIKEEEISEIEKLEVNEFKDKKNKLEKEDSKSLKKKKLYLYYMQLGKCMYTGNEIDINQLMDSGGNAKYDIDHIYPRCKVKDDSFDNLVLVEKVANMDKGDKLIPDNYMQSGLWGLLKTKGLISDEKYKRLMRRKEFTDEELGGFIARQLVETSQAVKAVITILDELNKSEDNKCEVCWVKAENVSDFRMNFGKIKEGNINSKNSEKLVKTRELNDYHHAKDAYLNIVVGNVYNVRFTKDPYDFINKAKGKDKKYSLNTLFYNEIKRDGVVAWRNKESIFTVEKVMNSNSVIVTRRAVEQKGELFDETVYKKSISKKDSYMGLKTKDSPLSDVTKYGGKKHIAIAYYSIIEYNIQLKKGIKKCIKIIPVPIYEANIIKRDEDLREYIRKDLEKNITNEIIEYNSIKLLYKKMCIGSTVKIDGFKYFVGGKSGTQWCIDGAVQVVMDRESEKYLKEISKALEWTKKDEGKVDKRVITPEKNMAFYNKLVEKMGKEPFINKRGTKYEELMDEEVKRKFGELSLEEQCKTLLNILNILNDKYKDKKNYEISNSSIKRFRSSVSFNLAKVGEFSIIDKSVTGLYEKETKILGD